MRSMLPNYFIQRKNDEKVRGFFLQNPKMNSSVLSRNNSNSTRGSVPSDSEFKQAYDQWKHMQIQSKQPPTHIRRSPLSPLTEMEKEVRNILNAFSRGFFNPCNSKIFFGLK